ncbi:MAG: FAD-dependent oxidoreductase [Deltaproteobacteria bacterium]|nr:FAD-dependent oxidoreductase [Deltaproteobacteria bacterium]
MRVIVVGAGIAGLSAAYILQKNGVEVKVLEKEKEVGGRCKSIRWHVGWIDLAAEMMISVDKGLKQMALEIGLKSHLQAMDKPDCVGGKQDFMGWRDGRFYPFSLQGKPSILTSDLLGATGKLRLAEMLPSFLKQKTRTRGVAPDAYELWRDAWADDMSLEKWLSRINPRLLTYFAEPFIDLFWGYRPKEISRQFFLHMMANGESDPSVLTTDQGYGLLPRKLAQKLDVETGARVKRVDVGSVPVSVEWETREGLSKNESADAVIIALPGCFVNDVIYGLEEDKAAFFNRVRYTPKEMVYFKLDKKFEYMLPWHVYPVGESPWFSGLAYGPSQISPDFDVLRVNMKTDFTLHHKERSSDEVLDAIQVELAKRYPEMAAAIEDRIIARWNPGIPQFYPGYIRSLAQFNNLQPTAGIEFAGDYLAFSTTGGAYYSGKIAAEKILKHSI